MENSIENIDLIILEKEYHQLTTDEKSAVSDFIANEQEYNDFKLMLSAVKAQLKDEKEIIPNPAIKAKLVADFEKFVPVTSLNNSNRGLVYFFPKEKSFFNKPGVQVLMAAAGIALLIGFAFNMNFENSVNNVAQIEKPSSKQELSKDSNAPSLEESITNEVVEESVKSESISPLTTTFNNSAIHDEKGAETFKYMSEDMGKPGNRNEVIAGTSSSVSVSDDNVLKESVSPISSESLTFATAPTYSMNTNSNTSVSDNTTTLESRKATSVKKTSDMNNMFSEAEESKGSGAKTPKKSKSLAENAELISYFYTAM
jgi:hypothetical protein